MDNGFDLVPYKKADGVEMLSRLFGKIDSVSKEWCAEPEQDGLGFTIIYEGKIIACAGLIKQREGVALAWALYPLDIGKYHIDPQVARNKLRELIADNNFWRVEATVRCDFPAGQSYLRYLGFKREGRMIMNEPDKTDSFLYAIAKRC